MNEYREHDYLTKKNISDTTIDNREYLIHHEVRPWIRYWARIVDLYLWGIFLRLILKNYIGLEKLLHPSFIEKQIFTILTSLTWGLIEAFLLSTWGYTIGKWILKTKVRDYEGNRLTYSIALKRFFMVFFYGEGLDITIIHIARNLLSYDRLIKKGITIWDEELELKVVHTQIGYIRIVLLIILIISIGILSFEYLNM